MFMLRDPDAQVILPREKQLFGQFGFVCLLGFFSIALFFI